MVFFEIAWGAGVVLHTLSWFGLFWIRYRLVRRIAREVNAAAERIESVFQRLDALADEHEEITSEVNVLCRRATRCD